MRLSRQAWLVVAGAVVLALALVVLVRNQSPDDELLAAAAALAGVAIVVDALPNGGNH